MDFEKFQKQIKWAEGRKEIYDSIKVEKLIEKVYRKKGYFVCTENKNFPLGYIFDFYGKKEKTFCVVNDELKEKLLKMCIE